MPAFTTTRTAATLLRTPSALSSSIAFRSGLVAVGRLPRTFASPPPQLPPGLPPTTSFLKRFFFGGSSSSPEDIMAAKQKAQQIIDEHPVAVFSKSYCPYCSATKTILSEFDAKPFIIELDQVDDGSEIQQALAEITGQRTVPNVFIGKKHIGGNSELQGKRKELPQLLKEAGAA